MQTYFKNYPVISYAIIAIEEQMFSDFIVMYVMQVNYDLLFHIYNFLVLHFSKVWYENVNWIANPMPSRFIIWFLKIHKIKWNKTSAWCDEPGQILALGQMCI